MTDGHARLFHDSAAAWRRRDFAFIQAAWAPDIVWWVAGANPLSGAHRGAAAIQAFFDRLLELTDGTLAPTIVGVCEGDGAAIMLTDLRARRDGVDYSLPEALVFRFNAAGKVDEVRQFLFDPVPWDEICRDVPS
jgi:ketosteroid isomerase-like protein